MGTAYYPDPNADTPRGSTRLQITGTTNTTPIEVTTAAHSYGTGDRVEIEGAEDPNAAGVWNVTVTSSTEFTLDGSVGTLAGGAFGTASNWTILPNTTIPSDGDLVDATNANTPVENALNLGAYPPLVNARWRIVDIYNERVEDTTPVTNTTWSTTTPGTAVYAFAQNNPVWGPGTGGESPGVAPIFMTGDCLDITFTMQLTYAAAGVLGAIALAISPDGSSVDLVPGSSMVLPTAGLNQCLTLHGRVYAADFAGTYDVPGVLFYVGVVVYGNAANPTYSMHGAYGLTIVHLRSNG